MSDRCKYCGSKELDSDKESMWCLNCGASLTNEDVY